jgi:hypothetical protein
MVTHSSTSRPVQCLCMAERTECLDLTPHRLGNAIPRLSARDPGTRDPGLRNPDLGTWIQEPGNLDCIHNR